MLCAPITPIMTGDSKVTRLLFNALCNCLKGIDDRSTTVKPEALRW
jgi:hypothetical protein